MPKVMQSDIVKTSIGSDFLPHLLQSTIRFASRPVRKNILAIVVSHSRLDDFKRRLAQRQKSGAGL
ncbi:MAG: hypothetical protein GY798_29790 [Hyphomicrobiales bacterium]|nr:hypothetical protein [Hyphomicrobiales bacterium]